MQNVDHDNVCNRAGRERQALRISHEVKPWRALDIARNHIGKSELELPNSAANFGRSPADTDSRNTVVHVIIDTAEQRLFIPDNAILIERTVHSKRLDPEKCEDHHSDE